MLQIVFLIKKNIMIVELIYPIAIEQGTKFSIREDGRTVGVGSVSKIIK